MSRCCCPVCPGILRAMLCLLLLTGLCSCHHEYHFINETKTWHEAQNYCRETYTDLATVDSVDDMEQLIMVTGSDYEGEVWIGLYDLYFDWKWSLGDRTFYNEDEWNFRRWYRDQPNNTRTQKQLCVVFQQGFWFDDFCNNPNMFACYNNTNLLDLQNISRENYFFINEKMSWNEARAYCRQNYTDLASVRNETENMAIQQVVPASQPASIGLYRFTWIWWSDGSSPNFKNWVDRHPLADTGNCAASVINATYHGEWVENNCNIKLNFVCHNKKKQLFSLKLKAVKSSVDLNEPYVLKTILKLMQKKMNDMGFTRDFTISWKTKSDNDIFHKE